LQWHRVTKDEPCPVCDREKYCMRNTNWSAVLCTKVENDHPVGESNAWLHVLDPEANAGYSKFEELFAVYQSNMLGGLPNALAESLGVTVESVEKIGAGFWPGEQAWIGPERDDKGRVVGLLMRFQKNGKKIMVKGSERGLIYEHPLPKTDKPIIIVEGWSDTLAAYDMGYVGVGRPSAEGGAKLLRSLLKGRDVIIVGENDDAGRKGMEKIAAVLKASCPSIRKVLPPAKFKDLRAWHPTAGVFEQWLDRDGDSVATDKVIEKFNPWQMANQWLDDLHTKDDRRLMHFVLDDWYRYNGTVYQKIDSTKDCELDNELYPYLNEFEIVKRRGKDVSVDTLAPTEYMIRNFKHAAKAASYVELPDNVFEPFYIGRKEVIDPSKIVAFRNGLLDVETGKLMPLNSDIFLTSTLPFDYDPKARCDLWDGTTLDWFNAQEDCQMLLQEWFGYNCIASNFMQQMLMLHGVRSSGKSTTLDVLQVLLGRDRVAPFDFASLGSQSRFNKGVLIGKYAALLSEDKALSPAEAQSILSGLKRIIGNDTVLIERKYKDPVPIKLFCRFTCASNDLPRFSDDSKAFRRRFNLLYYPNDYFLTPGKLDRRLFDKLKRELPGIANWALIGLRRLLKNGQFTAPESSAEHMQDFIELSSPIAEMVREYCELGKRLWEPVRSLVDLHRAVFEEQGLHRLSDALFKARLRSAAPGIKRDRRTVAGEQVYVYEGIQIKESAKRRYLGRP